MSSNLTAVRFIAGIALLAASQSFAQNVTPGTWLGGNPATNTPYFICLNVSEDGRRVTAIDTQCRGAQGNRENALEIYWEFGTTPLGLPCSQFSYRDIAQGDATIAEDGSFVHTFKNATVDTVVEGQFDTTFQVARGTAHTVTASSDCRVEWEARRVRPTDVRAELAPPDPAVVAAPPSVAPQGIAPGNWRGGSEATQSPFFACLNVSPDGERLTAIDTDCRGDQGQYQNAIEVVWENGLTPNGQPCSQLSYRNLGQGDVAIAADGTFAHTFENNFVQTEIVGRFDAANNLVLGTARTTTPGVTCEVEWTASPTGAP